MSKEQPMPSFEYGYVSYHTVVEKLIQYIAWFWLIVFLSILVDVCVDLILGREVNSNSDYITLWLLFYSTLAFLFTRIKITYRLDSQSFSRTVTPARVFGWLNKNVNFSEKGFKYIRLTRSSNINHGHYYAPPCFLITMGRYKNFGMFTQVWHEDLSLIECFNSESASLVYDFALEVQKLTGLEIVIDPQWADAYKR